MSEVTIRPLEETDAYTSVRWRNIPELWTYTAFKANRKITIQDELDWIKKVIKDPTSVRFAIVVDGVYVGNTYLTDISNGIAEYHIFIGEKEYWGKGVARKATVLTISYGKDKLKLHTITLNVKPENKAAFHLYDTMGFTQIGKDEGGFTTMRIDLAGWTGDPRDKIKQL